jgi:LPXTG-motif cell wall-anchored protein
MTVTSAPVRPKDTRTRAVVARGGASRTVASAGGVLLAASLILAGAPATAAPGDEHLAGLEYVALGDSYAAGYGLTPSTGLPVPGCDQSTMNYPHQVAAELGLDLTDVTCSGAETANISTIAQTTYSGLAPIQDTALSASTDVVTVTIGGNDLGFVDILTSCAALSATGPVVGDPSSPFAQSDCKSLYAPGGGPDYLAAAIASVVAPALNAVIADIAANAPNAKVFVVGYPALTPATLPAGPDGCFTSALGSGAPYPANSYPFTPVDVPYLHAVEALFDLAIGDPAAPHGATMISLFDATSAHSPCADPAEAYVNGVTVTSLSLGPPAAIGLAPGVMHPNAAGAAFQAAQVEAAIRAAFPAPAAPSGGPELAATGVDGVGVLAAAGLLLLLGGGAALRWRRRLVA